MKFVYPEFLYALFAIAIPIVIHLFNFRKFKKIYFSNVQFLKEVTQETQSKSKLKHLLILTSRILVISFLVFAFAQPYIPTSSGITSPKNKVVGIYVDNSFSMESTGNLGALLDEAKLNASEVVNNYNASDKFLVYTNAFASGEYRLLSQEQAIEKIEQIEIVPQTKNLSAIYSRASEGINNADIANKYFYLFSDFQKTISDFNELEQDSTINWLLIPITGNQTDNLYIDSCWFESPTHLFNQQEELKAIVVNKGEKDVENIPVKLFINEQLITPTSVSVKANDKTTIAFNYQNKQQGIQQGKIELRDHPVVTDDAFHFSYQIANQITILEIHDQQAIEKKAVPALYQTDSLFNFMSGAIGQLDYSLIKTANLIVLNELKELNSGLVQTLKSFVENGGSLLVFPAEEMNLESYQLLTNAFQINPYLTNDTSSLKVRDINYEHPIFNNVFEKKEAEKLNLPLVKNHYALADFNTIFRSDVLTLNNGTPFLSDFKINKGHVYLCASSLNKTATNFANHALFVPVLYNIAFLSQPTYPTYFIIGENNVININTSVKDNVFHLKNDNMEIIPKIKSEQNTTSIFFGNEITTAGNYLLTNETVEMGIAFNYNRKESDLACLTESELATQLTQYGINANIVNANEVSFKSALNEIESGKKYWKICVILALIFLAAEIALIKLWK